MMKHPKYRVPDVLVMDKDALREVYDYVTWGVKQYIPFDCRIQHCGSFTFGCANRYIDPDRSNRVHMASDFDFNLALEDWNHQVPAKVWFGSKRNKGPMIDHLMQWTIKTGLLVDMAVTDPYAQTALYNCYVSIDDGILHFRNAEPNEEFLIDDVWPLRIKTDRGPIDIWKFDCTKDELPAPLLQRLSFYNYSMRWMKTPQRRPEVEWTVDKWADEVPFWREKYGKYFQEVELVTPKCP